MGKNLLKRLCVFQLHYTDTFPIDEKFNPVVKLRKSGIFDHIVLAVPDIEQNRFLEKYARDWCVEIFFGAVDNVTQRIYDVARAYNCDLIARPSIYWFYLDPDLIRRMLDVLEEACVEMVLLPRNFDVTFGADVFSLGFLDEMLDLFYRDASLRDKFMHHPCGYAEIYPEEVNFIYFNDVPVYNQQRFGEVVESYRAVFPEGGVTADKTYPYRYILKYLQGGEKILDIACGHGTGTAVLANRASHVIGVDIAPSSIKKAKRLHKNLSNVEFICSDAFKLSFESETFDCIVSINTIEHIKDDKGFIDLLYQYLKDEGGPNTAN